jgi:hypothetical protein
MQVMPGAPSRSIDRARSRLLGHAELHDPDIHPGLGEEAEGRPHRTHPGRPITTADGGQPAGDEQANLLSPALAAKAEKED